MGIFRIGDLITDSLNLLNKGVNHYQLSCHSPKDMDSIKAKLLEAVDTLRAYTNLQPPEPVGPSPEFIMAWDPAVLKSKNEVGKKFKQLTGLSSINAFKRTATYRNDTHSNGRETWWEQSWVNGEFILIFQYSAYVLLRNKRITSGQT